MAGAGFKSWVDGDILTAGDVNTYLMQQAVMVFADASARSTALTAPSEGMVTYLSGTDVIEYYDGAAWQPILDQDVIEAKGDLIVGTADDTVARLAVGTNNYVLTADSGETTGMKWAALPVSTQDVTKVIDQAIGSGVSSVTVSNAFSTDYDQYLITISGCEISTNADYTLKMGATTTGYYYAYGRFFADGSANSRGGAQNTSAFYIGTYNTTDMNVAIHIAAPYLTQATQMWNMNMTLGEGKNITGILNNTTSYTDFEIIAGAGTMTGGNIRVYGYLN